jgi:hypothetical protein
MGFGRNESSVLEATETSSELAGSRSFAREQLTGIGVPADIVDRATDEHFDPFDDEKYLQLLLSCYGRLEHFQAVGSAVAALANLQLQGQSLGVSSPSTYDVRSLALEGKVAVAPLLTSVQAAAAQSWFTDRPCYNGHTPESSKDRTARFVGHTADAFAFGSYGTHDVVAAPHLLEAVLSEEVIGAASAHLGCLPTLSNLQIWWNFPGHDENAVPGGYAPMHYHRDLNDLRMFWLYMYLTDVDARSGPHMIIQKSSSAAAIKEALSLGEKRFPAISEKIRQLSVESFFDQFGYQIPREVIDTIFDRQEVEITGPAGTTFFSNGFNFHRVKYPLERRRLMAAARFSINPSVYDGPNRDVAPIPGDIVAGRIGDSPQIRYVTRKLFDWKVRSV